MSRPAKIPANVPNFSPEVFETELEWALPIGPSARESLDQLTWIHALVTRKIAELKGQ